MSNKMWGGRFAAGPDEIMEEINASIGFDYRFAPQDIRGSKAHVAMLADAGIVRHRGKIESTINNARRMLELETEHGSLYRWVQQFRPEPTRLTVDSELRATCPESVAMSKALKRKGWSFVGPTTMYAFMQAMGLVDDHIDGCQTRPR